MNGIYIKEGNKVFLKRECPQFNKYINLLKKGKMNILKISQSLDVGYNNVHKAVKVLEEIGMVEIEKSKKTQNNPSIVRLKL